MELKMSLIKNFSFVLIVVQFYSKYLTFRFFIFGYFSMVEEFADSSRKSFTQQTLYVNAFYNSSILIFFLKIRVLRTFVFHVNWLFRFVGIKTETGGFSINIKK